MAWEGNPSADDFFAHQRCVRYGGVSKLNFEDRAHPLQRQVSSKSRMDQGLSCSDSGTKYLNDMLCRLGSVPFQARPWAADDKSDNEITAYAAAIGGWQPDPLGRGEIDRSIRVGAAMDAVSIAPTSRPGLEFDRFLPYAEAHLDVAQQQAKSHFAATGLDLKSMVDQELEPSNQLTTQVLLELRRDGQLVGGPKGPWGCALALLGSCPFAERTALLLNMLIASSAFAESCDGLVQRTLEEDVHSASTAAAFASVHGFAGALVSALLSLPCGRTAILDKEISVLLDRVLCIPDTAHLPMALMITSRDFIGRLSEIQLGREGLLPESIEAVCRRVFLAANGKFGRRAADSAAVVLLTRCVILPRLMTASQIRTKALQEAFPAVARRLSQRIPKLSRILQSIAQHPGGRGSDTFVDWPENEKEVLRAQARELRYIAESIALHHPDARIIVGSSQEESNSAAYWIIQKCRRWQGAMASTSVVDMYRPSPNLESVARKLNNAWLKRPEAWNLIKSW